MNVFVCMYLSVVILFWKRHCAEMGAALCCLLQVYLQCALLYTTADGARRVRVSTLALPVSDQMGAVFKGADLDSQLAALSRQVRGIPVCTDRQCFGARQEGSPAITRHTHCLLQCCPPD
jgi:hypothetical protein